LEQLSADLPAQQDDFLSPSLPSFEEQLDAALPEQHEDLPSLDSDLASLEQEDLLSVQAAFFSSFPWAELSFSDMARPLMPENFIEDCLVFDFVVVALSEVVASDCALAAKAKNANTLRIRTFFIEL
jgi:hypothetical protein